MNKNTSENIYKYIFNISDVVWATNQKWKHYGYLMAERRWTLKHCQFIYFLQKCDSRGKISQAKHRKNHKSDFLSGKKKKQVPWSMASIYQWAHLFRYWGRACCRFWPFIHIWQQGVIFTSPYSFSNVLGLVLRFWIPEGHFISIQVFCNLKNKIRLLLCRLWV